MSENKYAIGIDFGTESGRAVLVETKTGKEIATSIYSYENGVIDEKLPPDGDPVRLEPEWALQDPQDYIRTFQNTVPDVLSQAGVGDIFAWFLNNCIPEEYCIEAGKRRVSVHQLLDAKAASQKPGQHGLLALDWWNGNRSVLVDVALSGLLIGATLGTQPEDIYRALIEATAYGTRVIIEAFERNGVKVDELVACGGLPEQNQMLMQIYADITGRNFKISASKQTPALGSAMFGAVAAGSRAGGYDTIFDAAKHMAGLKDEVYQPIPDNQKTYDRLYTEYLRLHDYFGRGENNVMKTLKQIRDEVS